MADITAGDLAEVVGARVVGDPGVVITSVTHDSARVLAGSLFCCLRGERFDGHAFAADAVAAGAVALLVDGEALVGAVGRATTLLVVDDTRAAMGPVASRFWSDPSSELAVIGVTGTNGKTTTVTIIEQVLAQLDVRCGVIGTLTGARTTPEATDLQAQLRAFADSGCDVVAMEVSSHALELHRVDGTKFAVAVFTNLGVDHLDFHHTQERYFQAKARLFDAGRAARGITNLDDIHGRLLRDAATIPMTTYSLEDLDPLVIESTGSHFTWREQPVDLPLSGRFNVSNAVAAAEAVAALGHDPALVAAALRHVLAPPGRFEMVQQGQPFAVVVDYAHTPDALENLLTTADELTGDDGRLMVVFGCGGDRDATKRPAMGAIATKMADSVLITSDNPRSEDPAAIIAAVKSGCEADARATSIETEIDRDAAIRRALSGAQPGDVVVIAGKGHETTQTSGSNVVAFDDRVVASETLQSLGWVIPA